MGDLSEHQQRLLIRLARYLDKYLDDKMSLVQLADSIQGLLSAGEFNDVVINTIKDHLLEFEVIKVQKSADEKHFATREIKNLKNSLEKYIPRKLG